MSTLPPVPSDLQGKSREYLVSLVRQLEKEFRRRLREQSDGKTYFGYEHPYVYVDSDGNQFEIGVDVLPPGLALSDLAANGGTIPETDRGNTFTEDQHTDGAGFIAENDAGNWFDAIVTDDTDSQIFRGRDSGDNIIGQIITRDLDGAGAGHLELAGLWAFASMPSVGADALIETGSNANGSWIIFAGVFAVAWRVVTPDWTQGSFQDWDMPITFGMEPMMFVTMHTHTGGGPGNAAIDVLQGCTTSASGGNDTFRIAFRDGLDAAAAGEQITITAMGTL